MKAKILVGDSSTPSLQMWTKFYEDFQLGGTFQKGAQGTELKFGVDIRTNKRVAVKVIPLAEGNAKQRARTRQEIKCLAILKDAPYTIHILKAYESDKEMVMVMELAEGGDLLDLVNAANKFSEEESRRFFVQIITALEVAHKRYITHRDLKPDNILLDKNRNIKLGDFGFACTFSPDKDLTSYCGTIEYMAPEMIKNLPYKGTAVDIWSLGCVLYVLCTGRLPFSGKEHDKMKKICKLQYSLPESLSPELRDLISRMLAPPSTRATLDQIKAHPWVTKSGAEPMKSSSLLSFSVASLSSQLPVSSPQPKKFKLPKKRLQSIEREGREQGRAVLVYTK